MGQGQSSQTPFEKQGRTVESQRPATAEEQKDPAEAARAQAEDRARRAAAAEQRLAAQKSKSGPKPGATSSANPNKKLSALEQMSKENRGWRDADANAVMRAYN